jgi:hypothetical protein
VLLGLRATSEKKLRLLVQACLGPPGAPAATGAT